VTELERAPAGRPGAGTAPPGERRPRVGIAVPSLDQGRFLGEALDSLLSQTGVDLEVAVLDGGSRDESAAVIGRYADRLAYWRVGPDGGQAAAVNEGIARLARAEYVGWLNADDILAAGALARMAEHLRAHPESVAVAGEADVVDTSGRVVDRFPSRPFSRRGHARTSIVCQPASLVARRAWDAVGGLDASLHMCLDYDLWWRLSALGPIGYLGGRPLAASRDHDLTKTRGFQDRLYAEAFAVLRRHIGYVPFSWCLSEAAFRWRAAHGGRRASDPLSQLVCVWRAAARHARLNRLAGLTGSLRLRWSRPSSGRRW